MPAISFMSVAALAAAFGFPLYEFLASMGDDQAKEEKGAKESVKRTLTALQGINEANDARNKMPKSTQMALSRLMSMGPQDTTLKGSVPEGAEDDLAKWLSDFSGSEVEPSRITKATREPDLPPGLGVYGTPIGP